MGKSHCQSNYRVWFKIGDTKKCEEVTAYTSIEAKGVIQSKYPGCKATAAILLLSYQ